MKSKSALFISAVLTAFILVVVTRVVSGITSKAQPVEPVVQVEPTQTETVPPETVNMPATTQPTTISAEMAATIAAQVLGKQDVSEVTGELLNGVLVYKVTFSTGEIVYISLQGQVLSVIQVQTAPTYNVSADSSAADRPRERASHSDDEGGDD